jgi:hypothetical protein
MDLQNRKETGGGITMDVMEKLVGLLKEQFYDEYEFEAVADDLISQGVTVQEWIPVTERLPEAGEIVLCHMKYGEMYILQRDSHAYYGWAGDRISYATSCVTHWMPLPEPPKEE